MDKRLKSPLTEEEAARITRAMGQGKRSRDANAMRELAMTGSVHGVLVLSSLAEDSAELMATRKAAIAALGVASSKLVSINVLSGISKSAEPTGKPLEKDMPMELRQAALDALGAQLSERQDAREAISTAINNADDRLSAHGMGVLIDASRKNGQLPPQMISLVSMLAHGKDAALQPLAIRALAYAESVPQPQGGVLRDAGINVPKELYELALNAAKPEIRSEAVRSLGISKDPASQALLRLVQRKNGSDAVNVALAMKSADATGLGIINEIIQSHRSGDKQLVADAATALGLGGYAAEDALPLLRKLEKESKHSDVRREVAEAITALGEQPAEAGRSRGKQ